MTDEERLIVWSEAYCAGWDRGYEQRVREENDQAQIEPRVLHFGAWYDQAVEREKADAETRRLVAEERAG